MNYTITLEYQGKQYRFLDEDYQDDSRVIWMYTEGNFGCDCNKSLFLYRYCDVDFESDERAAQDENREWTLSCGDTIKLISICEGERVVWPLSRLAQTMAVEQENARRRIQSILQYNREHPFECIRFFEHCCSQDERVPRGQLSLADLDALIEGMLRQGERL